MKSPIIETTTYRIRPFTESDTTLWRVWDVHPDVQAYMPEPINTPQTPEEQLEYIRACEAEETGYYWSIETKDGVTIGTVALTDIDEYHKLAELGIVIGDTRYWGKGAATEIVTAVVRYAFSTLGIMRISAEVEAGNLGVQKVLTTAGFAQDGLFTSARVKNGQRIDVLHFGVVNV